jgi:hypothetical protein
MAAILTADSDAITATVERLSEIGIHRLQAILLANGARFGRDAEVLQAAELEARSAGDRIVLLHILQAIRGAGARQEAHAICRTALDGLHGTLRLRFIEQPAVRWALGEPSALGRDSAN